MAAGERSLEMGCGGAEAGRAGFTKAGGGGSGARLSPGCWGRSSACHMRRVRPEAGAARERDSGRPCEGAQKHSLTRVQASLPFHRSPIAQKAPPDMDRTSPLEGSVEDASLDHRTLPHTHSQLSPELPEATPQPLDQTRGLGVCLALGRPGSDPQCLEPQQEGSLSPSRRDP